MRNVLIYIIAACACTVISCQVEETTYLTDLESSHNLLNVKRTNYTYKANNIYSIELPDYEHYGGFGISQFFFIQDGVINMLSIDKNCYDEYKEHRYRVETLSEISDESQLNACRIFIMPFVKLNSKIGDTLFTYTKEGELSDYWSILERKYYSNVIKDTVYKFKRHIGSLERKLWVYYIAKEKGIVGMTKIDWGRRTDSVGYPFIQEMFP